ncbi:hypothetical protein CA13_69620 [Planctomycetes bacterium CA13]|uniref:Uncharacterized protein n=1 Tax=Novipirellula herctigrandis TaxID=2527986 RepID=A0A5C5YNX1_9BACT|nr:hypothetical protein CA13_69620 [Planctomycetes bacterium CA13]
MVQVKNATLRRDGKDSDGKDSDGKDSDGHPK